MHNFKKILAMLLALAMVFSMMTAAFATEAGGQTGTDSTGSTTTTTDPTTGTASGGSTGTGTDPNPTTSEQPTTGTGDTTTGTQPTTSTPAEEIDPKYQEAIDVLKALKIMVGDGTAFRPKSTLTRGEYAALLFKLYTGLNAEDDPTFAPYGQRMTFTDVPTSHYAAIYINYLAASNVLAGVGGGKFEPDRAVTGYEALCGLLQAIGYGKLGEFGDSWGETKLQCAVLGTQTHVTSGLSVVLGNDITREQFGMMIFNALTDEAAHVVTLKTDGKSYVESESGAELVTLGAAHWELHRYNPANGNKYASDKQVDAEPDEFGRPQNPKWVAMVGGEVITLGDTSDAILSYYQDEPLTRIDFENDLYREFRYRDSENRIEYYVDGLELDDETSAWNLHDVHEGVSDYDTIGGTGVSIEVYLMANKTTAISADDVDQYPDLNDGTRRNTYPKIRVVVIHHYAAMLTKNMIIAESKTSKTPAHLELPYDVETRELKSVECDKPTCPEFKEAHYFWVSSYKAAKVQLNLTDTENTYKAGDVIYYDVAISEGRNGRLTYSVRNDVNLSSTEGCKVESTIIYMDPDKTYIRMKDVDGDLLFNDFLQHTTTPDYSIDLVTVSRTEKQTVYLDPTGTYVTLVYNEPKPAGSDNASYYYVEAIEMRIGRTSSIWDDMKTLVAAKVINVETGKSEIVELDYVIDKTNTLTHIAGKLLQDPVSLGELDSNTYKVVDLSDAQLLTEVKDKEGHVTSKVYVGPAAHQFVRIENAKDVKNPLGKYLDYDMRELVDDCNAYDDDSSLTYKISSNLFELKSVTPVINVKNDTYNVDYDTTVLATEDTKLYAYKWNDSTNTATLQGEYTYSQMKNFVTADPDAHFLVVTYTEKSASGKTTYERAKFIVVISDDVKEYKKTNTYYGIYCGPSEISSDKCPVVFVNEDGMKTWYIDPEALNESKLSYRYVGYVFAVTVDEKDNVTKVELAEDPQTVIDISGNLMITADADNKTDFYNLKNATFFYVGDFGLAEVDVDYIDPNDNMVGVYEQADGSLMVVIYYADDVEDGFADGHPNYGNIDVGQENIPENA